MTVYVVEPWGLNGAKVPVNVDCVGPLPCGFVSENILKDFFGDFGQFEKTISISTIFFSLSYFTIRIKYIIHRIYKICVNLLLVLLVRLLVLEFLGIQKLYVDFQLRVVGTPNPHVV